MRGFMPFQFSLPPAACPALAVVCISPAVSAETHFRAVRPSDIRHCGDIHSRRDSALGSTHPMRAVHESRWRRSTAACSGWSRCCCVSRPRSSVSPTQYASFKLRQGVSSATARPRRRTMWSMRCSRSAMSKDLLRHLHPGHGPHCQRWMADHRHLSEETPTPLQPAD